MGKGVKISKNPKITRVTSAFIRVCEPDFRFRGETHEAWELVCVTDGHISVAADNKIFELKKGQAILHSPMQFHNITVMGNESAVIGVFAFYGENIPPLQNQVFEITDLSKVKTLKELAHKYYDVYKGFGLSAIKKEGTDHLLYIKNLELFLLELAGNVSKSRQVVTEGAKNYSRIINTLSENIYERLSVCELAALCNMSEINLQKTFSRYAGVGIMEYFNRIKMRKATELLVEGLSVKETALKLGFHDQNYFSTMFKRITGHTPSKIKQA